MGICHDRYHDSIHYCIYVAIRVFFIFNFINREFYRSRHELKIRPCTNYIYLQSTAMRMLDAMAAATGAVKQLTLEPYFYERHFIQAGYHILRRYAAAPQVCKLFDINFPVVLYST